MAIYRITVITAKGRLSFSGLFASSCEAADQALADWPEATCIGVKCILGAKP